MMRKLLLAAGILLAATISALAQSGCSSIATGAVLTAAQWNACFAAKQNVIGFTPVNRAGDTMLGRLTTIAPSTVAAGFNLPHGSAPTSPGNGDTWTTTAGMFVRINGTTIGPLTGSTVTSFAGTSPITVSFPSSVVTYALNYTSPYTGGTLLPGNDKLGQRFDARDFGVTYDGADRTADYQRAVTACLTAASGTYYQGGSNELKVGPGALTISDEITISNASASCKITGTGMGGVADPVNVGGTRIIQTTVNKGVYNIATGNSIQITDQYLALPLTSTSGNAGITIQGETPTDPTKPNFDSRISNVRIRGGYMGLDFYNFQNVMLDHVHADGWYYAGARFRSTVLAPDAGIVSLDSNFYLSATTAAGSACVLVETGSNVEIYGSHKCNGGETGYLLSVTGTPVTASASGGFRVTGGSIENQTKHGVRVKQLTAGTTYGTITLDNLKILQLPSSTAPFINTFLSSVSVAAGAAPYVTKLNINNSFLTQQNGLAATALAVVDLASVSEVDINHNNIDCGSVTTCIGIRTAATATEIRAVDNDIRNVTGGKFSFGAPTLVVDRTGMTVAQLPANAADGTTIYTTNGYCGTSPIASTGPGGAGGGCYATKQAGVWTSTPTTNLAQNWFGQHQFFGGTTIPIHAVSAGSGGALDAAVQVSAWNGTATVDSFFGVRQGAIQTFLQAPSGGGIQFEASGGNILLRLSGIAHATNIANVSVASMAAARQINLADPGGTDTLAYLAAPQTLLAKTLTSPAITNPTITGSITATGLVTNAALAASGAATFKGNPTSGSTTPTDFTVQGLTDITTPSTTLDFLPIYNHTTGTLQRTTAAQLVAAVGGGVTSVTPGSGLTSTLTATAPGSAITSTGTLSAAHLINAQTGTSYAILDSDRAKLITASNAAAQAYTIAQAGAASAFQAGWFVDVNNISTNPLGLVTITPTTSTINGVASLVLGTGQSVRIVSDGTNYRTELLTGIRVVKVTAITTSGTYTPSTGMLYAIIECVGGGGAGGGAVASVANNSAGGGGGAAGYSKAIASASTIGASQTATIGAGGTAGTAGNNPGNAGGDTSLGSICVGKGGSGGGGAGSAGIGTLGAGGVAGTGSFTPPGASGGTGYEQGTSLSYVIGGAGGSSRWGAGGNKATTNTSSVGVAGSLYGGGGSGAVGYNDATASSGGAGAAGAILITEFTTQ